MAQYICTLLGSRGRTIELYDTKCVIKTKVTVGSVLTNNATDGIKTIFYLDCAGVQFKEPGVTIGYLQFETPSMQMNNQTSNFFSENTFTFEGPVSIVMDKVYRFVCDCIESHKYKTPFPTDGMFALVNYLDEQGYRVSEQIRKEAKERKAELIQKRIEENKATAEQRKKELKNKLGENMVIARVSIIGDSITCPTCTTAQRANRSQCYHCGTIFEVE